MASPHDVLDVPPDALPDEIERAYRRRIKETHPDQGGTVEAFTRVREAYEQLRDGSMSTHPEQAPFEDRQKSARVEYLNYQVLDDHDWSLDDPGLFEKAGNASLSHEDYGRILVEPGETILEAAEERGYTWPFSCRGGACANCAIAVVDGDMQMDVDTVLSEELLDRNVRLSCIGRPVTENMQIVYNLKELPELEELRLPTRPWARSDD